jgi:hypothetical protein
VTEPESAPTEVPCDSPIVSTKMGCLMRLGGALALGAWGVPRTTSDVDVSAFVSERELDRLLDSVERAGAMVERVQAHGSVARTGFLSRSSAGRASMCSSPIIRGTRRCSADAFRCRRLTEASALVPFARRHSPGQTALRSTQGRAGSRATVCCPGWAHRSRVLAPVAAAHGSGRGRPPWATRGSGAQTCRRAGVNLSCRHDFAQPSCQSWTLDSRRIRVRRRGRSCVCLVCPAGDRSRAPFPRLPCT